MTKINYFTSIFPGSSEENEKQRKRHNVYLSALETHCPKINIIKGHFRIEKTITCKECNKVIYIPEEKKTDVNIACEILKDSYEDNFDIAYLVSGDSDLVAPVESVVDKKKIVIIACPPKRLGRELIKSATNHFRIYPKRLKKCLLPKTIQEGSRKIVQPQEWQLGDKT